MAYDNNEMKVATFMSHYGAMLFRRGYGEGCTLRPVPRSLSSSCGTAAFFEGPFDPSMVTDLMEAVYEKDGDEWRMIYGKE